MARQRLLLLGALLLAFGMVRDDGPRGAVLAAACFAAGVGVAFIVVKAVVRRRRG
jgi:hypothetical protein